MSAIGPKQTSRTRGRMSAFGGKADTRGVLLASWKKGKAARFFSLQSKSSTHEVDWVEVSDLRTMFS